MEAVYEPSQQIDFSQVPLLALRPKTLKMLSDYLNPERVLPNDKGYPRDWRGLHELANLQPPLPVGEDPTRKVLHLWSKEASSRGLRTPSLADLKQLLGELDRWDIVDDTAEMMDADAQEYLLVDRSSLRLVEEVNKEADSHILTRDDIPRISCGLPAQNYDAFLLYADEDEDFALQMIQKLENDYHLKLCVKERDLIGGFFEHEAIMRLIAERCNRLIVILSPNFLNDKTNRYFLTYAQALGIEQTLRKVVPCLYQPCRIPSELSHCFFLDYNRSGKLFDFWGKLKDSVQSLPALPSVPSSVVHTSRIENGLPHSRDDRVKCFVQEVHSMVQEDPEPTQTGHTALVCLSDPSTLYPSFNGVEYTNGNVDQWSPSKPSEDIPMNTSSCPSTKPKSSSSFLKKLLPKNLPRDKGPRDKEKQRDKWFSKKKAVALENS